MIASPSRSVRSRPRCVSIPFSVPFRLMLAFALLLYSSQVGGSLDAQTASLTASDVTATIATTTSIPITTSHSHEADGYSFGLLLREPEVTVISVELGAAVLTLQASEASVPSFFDVNLSPSLPTLTPAATGGFTVGLVFDFSLTPVATRLPIGNDQEIGRASCRERV